MQFAPIFNYVFYFTDLDKLPEEHEFIKLLTLLLVVFAFSTEKTSTKFSFESSLFDYKHAEHLQ